MTTTGIGFEVILPPEMDSGLAATRHIRAALIKERDKADKLLRKAHFRWSQTMGWNDKPDPIKHKKYTTRHAGSHIYSSAWVESVRFYMLNFGTSVRHSAMSHDFIPRTRPGKLTSFGARRGGVLFVHRRIRRGGINPRRWDELIQGRRLAEFNKSMQETMGKIAKTAIFTGS